MIKLTPLVCEFVDVLWWSFLVREVEEGMKAWSVLVELKCYGYSITLQIMQNAVLGFFRAIEVV